MNKLSAQLRLLSTEQRARLEQRLLLQRNASGVKKNAIPRRLGTGPCALSLYQQRLWFLDQLSPNTATYNVPAGLQIRGPLDILLLERSFQEVVRRHEVLRTTFACPAGEPVQGVRPEAHLQVACHDLRSESGPGQQALLERLLNAEAARPFDLTRDLMLRAALFRLADEDFILLITTHHIAWDLHSKAILYAELAAVYNGAGQTMPTELPDLPIQYADFAVWQRESLQGETLEKLVAYWKQQLGEVPPALDMPLDFPRPAVQTLRGRKHFFSLPGALLDKARALSRQHHMTPYMTLLGAFNIFLLACTGQDNVCIGSPIASRNSVETENLIGFFINTLLLRIPLGGNPTYLEVLKRVRGVMLGAQEHQDLPFEKLVELLRPPRDLSRNPLFQVNFRIAGAPQCPPPLNGLEVSSMNLIDNMTSKFDLALELATVPDSKSYWEYSSDLFADATVERMVIEFETLLAGLLEEPEKPLSDLAAFRDLQAVKTVLRSARKGAEFRKIARRPVELS